MGPREHELLRPGHHRPLGTTTRMQFPNWPKGARPPRLGDIISQTDGPYGDPDDVQRSYEVVGVEEARSGYRLVCERIAYGQPAASRKNDVRWTFFNLPRR